jgi:hypothetical protein
MADDWDNGQRCLFRLALAIALGIPVLGIVALSY